MLPDWFWTAAAFVVAPILAAFLSGYAVNRWKGRQEHLEKRFDDLCAVVLDTAALASEYWAGSARDEGMRLLEAKIQGHLIKIAGLRVMLSGYISNSASREMERAESLFIRQTTGGDFGVHDRTTDLQRVVGCQCAAAELIVAIRTARLKDWRGWWTRN